MYKRQLETNTKFQKIATIGGRVRGSTTGLILALLVVGALALASSNPENADAGWLSPEHWRDSGAEASSSPLSDAPSTNHTPETAETGTQYEPTEDGAAPTEAANPQGANGAGATNSPAGGGGGQGTGATGNASPAPSTAGLGSDNGSRNASNTGSDAGDGTQASGTAGSTGQEIPAEPR